MVRQRRNNGVRFRDLRNERSRSNTRRTPKIYYPKFGTPICFGHFRVLWGFRQRVFLLQFFKAENKRLWSFVGVRNTVQWTFGDPADISR